MQAGRCVSFWPLIIDPSSLAVVLNFIIIIDHGENVAVGGSPFSLRWVWNVFFSSAQQMVLISTYQPVSVAITIYIAYKSNQKRLITFRGGRTGVSRTNMFDANRPCVNTPCPPEAKCPRKLGPNA